MAISARNYSVARFSSRGLPEQGRGRAIEEFCERSLLASKFRPCGEALPHVDLANRIVPGLRILTATYAGVCHESVSARTGAHAGDLSFCMILNGTSLASRRGREVVLSDGDAVLMTDEEAAWTFASPASVKVAGLRLPRSALAPLVPRLDDAVMRRVPRDAGGLRLLIKYLELVADDEALAAPASQQLIINHFYDLAALALGAKCGGEGPAEGTSVGAVRLAAIKADIVANLDDGNLNATMVATRNRVTVRYLHKLFETEAVTYSEFVLGERLARAYGILKNPLHSRRAIGTIAFDVGFNDLSYFNRAFRRRYNTTPSDVRNGDGEASSALAARPTTARGRPQRRRTKSNE
jgi:AraC-like DNA-binding protein